LYTPDAVRGYALRPHAEGWEVAENENYVHINGDGMYDHERSRERPSNVIRIAVIGSSEAEAHTVALEKTFEAVAERQLSAAIAESGCRVEVLNFAVPGYSVSQIYLTLHDQVWQYNPQVVILAATALTILRNTRRIYPAAPNGTPFYELENGRLVLDEETRNKNVLDPARLKWRWRFSNLMNQSRLLSMLNEALINGPGIARRIRANLLSLIVPVQAHTAPNAIDYMKLSYDPDWPEARQSWAIADAFFKLMKQDSEQHSAEFWIVAIESSGSVHPSLEARSALRQKLGLNSLQESERYIEQLAHTDGIPEITLTPGMAEYAARHQVAVHGFFNTAFNEGHLNETGHAVAASIISQNLFQRSAALRMVRNTNIRSGGDCGCPESAASRTP
jgi:hypothetical protein